MKPIEICDVCDRPTGNAGIMDDSIQCEGCGDIICEDCKYESRGERVFCIECGMEYYGDESYLEVQE